MKREKRRGKKTAKRMQTRVSLLSGLGAGVALPGTHCGRIPAEGRVVAEMWPAWALPCKAGYVLAGDSFSSVPFPLCPYSSRQRLWVSMAPA